MFVTRFITRFQRAILPVAVAVAVIMLSSCQNLPTLLNPDDLYDPAAHSSYYIAHLQQSQGELCNTWRLLAARALLQEGQVAPASLQLQSLSQPLTLTQQQEKQLLLAEIALNTPDPLAAQHLLGQLTASSLLASQQQRYYQLQQTLAKIQQDPLSELHALIALQPLLPQSDQSINREQTWQVLTALPPACQQVISQQVISQQSHANLLQGWLALLAAYQDNPRDTKRLRNAIADWQLRYPRHPAADRLPEAIIQHLNLQPVPLDKIGLLLPLSGKAALFGQSVRQGFLDAARQATTTSPAADQPELLPLSQSADTPVDANHANHANVAHVIIYDSALQPLQTILSQAKRDKISLLVGPLLKQDVEQLSKLKTPFPILALNLPEQPQKHPQRCYYGLSPKDEAQAAARHLWHQQKRHPLVLVPRSRFGEQSAQAFQKTWQQLSDHPVVVHHFAAVSELKQAINHWSSSLITAVPPVGNQITNGPIDEQIIENAEPNPDSAKQHLGFTWNEYPAAGGDHPVDAVYMVTTPEEFMLLKSMIDMATAEGVKRPALYASSRSFQSTIGPDLRLEMEGLQFSDIPLLIAQQHQQTGQHAAKLFNNDHSLIRLYALGLDAWLLANHFGEINQLSYFKLSGATGILSADPQGIIHRQLPWIRYRQGQLVLVP